jgi:phage/plasmid primase-like uncharacterized protein
MRLNHGAPRSARRVDYDFRNRVRAAAEGRWHLLLQKLGVSASLLTGEEDKCPECGGAFKFIDANGCGSFVCRRQGRPDAAGDGFSLVGHVGRLDFGQAVRAVGQVLKLRELPAMGAERSERWWRRSIVRGSR